MFVPAGGDGLESLNRLTEALHSVKGAKKMSGKFLVRNFGILD